MSSMRNAIHRREHRERAQPHNRGKWGLLEKHKDYSLRAQDYNAKKSKLKRLQEKASARNPDEFAFGMMSEKARTAGRHGARDSATAQGLSHEAIKLLKTQDAGYLRTVGERVRRELERVEQDVQLQEGMRELIGEDGGQEEKEQQEEEDEEFDFGDKDDTTKKKRKLVFADDKKEQRKLKKRGVSGDMEDDMVDDQEDASFEQIQKRNQKLPRRQLEAERQALVEERRARKLRKRAAQARQNKLVALQKQHSDIVAAERELDWQRGKLDNSVGGTNKNGVKWKIRERKK